MGERQTIIRAISLCKEHQIGDFTVQALKGINLEIIEGEFVCIEGPSGAGKTSILNLVGGLDKPTSGDIMVSGYHLNDHDEDFLAAFRCEHVGFVFQSYNLISTLTALENVAFALELAGISDERIIERPLELLKQLGLSDRANHFPFQLSGGEQQRVAFARALANDPPIMLVDEPTANLDDETASDIVKILRRLKQKGKTVVVATHDQKIIQLADRVLRLRDGVINE